MLFRSASLSLRGEQHQAGSNPGESGDAGFGKRRGQQQSRGDCCSMTRTKPREEFHRTQPAVKGLKGKLQKRCGRPSFDSAGPSRSAVILQFNEQLLQQVFGLGLVPGEIQQKGETRLRMVIVNSGKKIRR